MRLRTPLPSECMNNLDVIDIESAVKAVIFARTPGMSGTGMRISDRLSIRRATSGKELRAFRALSNSCFILGRSDEEIASRTRLRSAIYSVSASVIFLHVYYLGLYLTTS